MKAPKPPVLTPFSLTSFTSLPLDQSGIFSAIRDYLFGNMDAGPARSLIGDQSSQEDTTLIVEEGWLTDPDGLADEPFTINDGPSHGVLNAFNAATGAYTYTPDENYTGEDSFEVMVEDACGYSSRVVVNIAISPVDDGPAEILEGGTGSGLQGEEIANTLKVYDPDGLSSAPFEIAEEASHGVAVIDTVSGYCQYISEDDYAGDDQFKVQVTDAQGFTSIVEIELEVEAKPVIPDIPRVIIIPPVVVPEIDHYLDYSEDNLDSVLHLAWALHWNEETLLDHFIGNAVGDPTHSGWIINGDGKELKLLDDHWDYAGQEQDEGYHYVSNTNPILHLYIEWGIEVTGIPDDLFS